MPIKTFIKIITATLTLVIAVPGTKGICRADMHEMEERGNKVMGFDQMKTTHHFRLQSDGGIIEVLAKDPNDGRSKEQIRHHLSLIARMFAQGDFNSPMLIHAQNPPGSQTMRKLKAQITYKFVTTDRGGLVHITTGDPEALAAIHEFLRFQIKEHHTGDPLNVTK